MNPRLDDNELFALLDDAANEITPVPDLGRLDAALRGPRRTRPVVYGVTAAAAVALLVGGAAAARWNDDVTDPAGPAGGVELVPTPSVDSPAVEWPTFDPPVTTPADDSSNGSRVSDDGPRSLDDSPTLVIVDTTTTTQPKAPVPTAVPSTTVAPVPAAPPPTKAPAPATTAAPPTTKAPAPATTAAPPTTKAPPTAPPTTKPPAPTTTHPPATTTTNPPVGFSANQTWGSCGEDPPYEELYGTAPTGTTINVSSPYGSASTTADGSGHWHVKVIFSGPPANETFTIDVTSSAGSKSFPFFYSQ